MEPPSEVTNKENDHLLLFFVTLTSCDLNLVPQSQVLQLGNIH